MSIQGQVIELVYDLTERMNLSVLLLSHDLDIVGSACDCDPVVNQDKLDESGNTFQILIILKRLIAGGLYPLFRE